MFKTKSDTEKQSPSQGYPLPEGHDDPTGPYFVPEFLHDAWAKYADTRLAQSHHLLNGTIRAIAEYELEKAGRPEKFDGSMFETTNLQQLHDGMHWNRVRVVKAPHLLAAAAEAGAAGLHSMYALTSDAQQQLGPHLEEHAERIRPEAQHAIRLKAVSDAFNAEVEQVKRAKRDHAMHLCPICGVSDATKGPVTSRDIAPAMPWKNRSMLSCIPCYFVAVARLAARAEEQQVGQYPHLHTRAQIIDSYLDEKGL